MEKRGIGLEILGVPNIIPDDRIVDKLLIHFLRPRNGGGEIQRVLYPCLRPEQALVIFEEPEVAARVLQQRHHVLEMNGKGYPLEVKAADRPEVDIPVEATLDLSVFADEAGVRQLLTTRGFEISELGGDRVRVKGYFMTLTAVKANLEKLLISQTETRNRPSSSSPALNGHTGAVSKCYTNSSSAQAAGRNSVTSPGRRFASSPSSPVSCSSGASGSPRSRLSPPEHQRPAQPPHRPSPASFVIDEDVLRYALCLKKAEMSVIVDRDGVVMREAPASPGLSEVTLSGRSAVVAMGKLQSLLGDLTKALRTQEIYLSELDHDSQVSLGRRIGKYKDIYQSVIISQVNGRIRIVGPSDVSFEVKQRLLGNPVAQPAVARTGRPIDRGQRHRSSSLPRFRSKEGVEAPRGAPVTAPPAGAHGYSPSKYRDERKEEKAADLSETEIKRSYAGPKIKSIKKLMPDFRQKLKNNTKK